MSDHALPASVSRRRLLQLGVLGAGLGGASRYWSRLAVLAAGASTVWKPPRSIDRTGSTDVSAALNDWLVSVVPQPGDVVELAGTFLLTDSLKLGSAQAPITGVTFDLTAATLTMPTVQVSQFGRPVLSCVNLHDCVIAGGTIVGANARGADGVNAGLAGWHGITIGGGTTSLTLSGQTVRNVWGDFVFVGGGNNQNLGLAQLTGAVAGRHAISVRHASGLTITNSAFSSIQHLFFDHEPHSGDGLTNLEICNFVGPAGDLGLFLQLRPLASTPCSNIYVHDHILTKGHYHIVGGSAGVQRDGFRLEHLTTQTTTATSSLPLITIGSTAAGYDNVVISDVHDLVTDPTRAVQCLNCPNARIDLSGIAT